MQPSAPFFHYPPQAAGAAAAAPPPAASPPYPASYFAPPPQQQHPHYFHPPPFAAAPNHSPYPQPQNYPPYFYNAAASSQQAHDLQPLSHTPHWQSPPIINMPHVGLPGLGSSQNPLAPPPAWQSSANGPQAASLPRAPPPAAQVNPVAPLPQSAVPQAITVQDRSDKEEGELSDRDLAKAPPVPAKSPNLRPPSGPRNPASRRDPARGNISRQPAPANLAARAHSSNTDSVRNATAYDSYRPSTSGNRQRKSPDYSAMEKDSGSISKTFPARSLPAARETDGITQDYLTRERAKAKAFVLAWHQNGFTYDQLVAEDLDAQILKDIYDELGIVVEIGRDSSGANVTSGSPLKSRPAETDRPSDALAHIANNHPARSPPVAQNVPLKTSQSRSGGTKAQEQPSNPGLPRKPSSSKPAQASLQISGTAKEANLPDKPIHTNHSAATQSQVVSRANKSISPQPSKASQPGSMDRESYIARLMAAKSKKSSTEQQPSVPASTQVKESSKPVSEDHAASTHQLIREEPKATSPRAAIANPASQAESNAARSESPLAQATAAAKRKAQTELARKRMEALTSARLKASQASANLLPTDPSPVPVDHSASSSLQGPLKSNDLVLILPDSHSPEGNKLLSKSGQPSARVTKLRERQEPIMVHEPETEAEQSPTLSPSQSRIPGLFMTAPTLARASEPPTVATSESSSADVPSLPTSFMFSAVPANLRKRPVASDFNDDFQDYPASKRPFGLARSVDDDESIIIEASDDENAPGDDMGTTHRDPRHPEAAEVISTVELTLDSLGQPFPSQVHAPDSQASNSHENSTTKPSQPRDKDYLQHQKNILAMKLQIAKLEQQRKIKSRFSNPTTPGTPRSEIRSALTGSPHLGDRIAEISRKASLSAQSGESDASSDSPRSSLEIANQQSAASLRVRPSSPGREVAATAAGTTPALALDWKNRRRTEIQSGIPALEASFADDTRQLELLREQMRRIEEDMRRKQEDKERLVQELESLGVDTEGMAHSDLQATKDELTAQMEEGEEVNGEIAQNAPQAAQSVAESESSRADSDETSASSMSISSPEETTVITERHDDAPTVQSEGEGSLSDLKEDQSGNDSLNAVREHLEPATMNAHTTSTNNSNSVEASSESPSDSMRDDAVVPNTEPSLSNDVVHDTPYAQSPIAPSKAPRTFGQVAVDHSEQDLSEGEIRESESDKGHDKSRPDSILSNESEEYAPPDSALESRTTSNQDPTASALEDDEYEPAEIVNTPELSGEQHPEDVTSDGLGEYQPPNAQEETFEAIYDAKESGDEYDPDEDYVPGAVSSFSDLNTSHERLPSAFGDAEQHASGSTHDANIADELATERQSAPDLQKPDSAMSKSALDLPAEDRFVPYQSALKAFKAFRFHPEFGSSVSGGFRSNTFSHSIDPQKPWCAFEAAGGVCNDDKCEAQHFRSMYIQDDDMVRQVGMANPGQTPEERSNFTEGLKSVLMELKQQNINDSEAVASEIAAYRRRFLKDPWRVL